MKKVKYNESDTKPVHVESNVFKSGFIEDDHVVIIVVTRLGFDKALQSNWESLLQYMSLQCSLGAIGGVPKRALYFIGHENNELIYLDPHKVQQAVDRVNLDKQISTFFC